MATINTIMEFFKNGGPFMVPIAIVLFIGLAIALERFLFLSYAKTTNKIAFNRILPLLKKRADQQTLNCACYLKQ